MSDLIFAPQPSESTPGVGLSLFTIASAQVEGPATFASPDAYAVNLQFVPGRSLGLAPPVSQFSVAVFSTEATAATPDVRVRCVRLDSERRPARDLDAETVILPEAGHGVSQVSGEVTLKPGSYLFQVIVDSRATAKFSVEV